MVQFGLFLGTLLDSPFVRPYFLISFRYCEIIKGIDALGCVK